MSIIRRNLDRQRRLLRAVMPVTPPPPPPPPLVGGPSPFPPPPPPNLCSSLALRLSRLSPLLLAAALVALAVLFAPGTQPAQAQTTVLVSNAGQTTVSGGWNTAEWSTAQAFITGSESGGYTLGSIDAVVGVTSITEAQRNSIRAELWSAATGGTPGSKLADLTVPAHPISTSIVSFAAPANTRLTARTTYYVVIYTIGTFNMLLQSTNSDSEDSGAAAGWSIANGGRNVNIDVPTSTSTWSAEGTSSIKITVNGEAAATNPPPPPPAVNTEYWSTTLSVKAVDYGFGCGYRTGQPRCSTALGTVAFVYKEKIHEVELVHVAYGDTLQFILDSEPVDTDHPTNERSRMALNVGSKQFRVKDAQVSYGIADNNVWTNEDAWVLTWTNSGLSWSEGDSVPLSVVTLPVGGL